MSSELAIRLEGGLDRLAEHRKRLTEATRLLEAPSPRDVPRLVALLDAVIEGQPEVDELLVKVQRLSALATPEELRLGPALEAERARCLAALQPLVAAAHRGSIAEAWRWLSPRLEVTVRLRWAVHDYAMRMRGVGQSLVPALFAGAAVGTIGIVFRNALVLALPISAWVGVAWLLRTTSAWSCPDCSDARLVHELVPRPAARPGGPPERELSAACARCGTTVSHYAEAAERLINVRPEGLPPFGI